jgi:hypothetical protein
LIEREDQGAIEAGGVVSAGGVTEMMIEVGGSRAVAKKLVKKLLHSGAGMTLAARACSRKNAIGEANAANFRKLQMILEEAAIECKARDFRGILQTSEFFLFNGEENTAVIQECNGGTAA